MMAKYYLKNGNRFDEILISYFSMASAESSAGHINIFISFVNGIFMSKCNAEWFGYVTNTFNIVSCMK